jgi:hypothetical protein
MVAFGGFGFAITAGLPRLGRNQKRGIKYRHALFVGCSRIHYRTGFTRTITARYNIK